MPVRIYDLSKEVGISNKEMLEKLQKMGLKVKSQSSTIDKITAEAIRNEYGIVTPAPPPKPSKTAPLQPPPSAPESPPEVPPKAAAPPATGIETPVSKPTTPREAGVEAPTISVPARAEPARASASTTVIEKPAAEAKTAPPPARPPVVGSKPAAPAVAPPQPPSRPAVAPPVPVKPQAPAPPPPPVSAGETLRMKPPVVVKDLAARLGLKPYQLISELMEMNVFATISQTLDETAAKKACARHGVQFELEKRDHHGLRPVVAAPEPLVAEKKERAEDMKPRPPVVTFMGHVDHGKTSLLDAIRKANVAARESGGITQHIGAYTVEVRSPGDKGQMRRITFLDTPGHEAFTAMRARGANLTDVVVLVVAADDGIMPQTVEALNHARAANVALIVAINKMDLPTANPERIKRQLQEHELTPEEWGGNTIVCEVSATTQDGLDRLLEMILLQAEILELKANAKLPGSGNVVESQMEPAGPTATVLVRKGTLKVGDPILCDRFHGKVKALNDYQGKRVKTATPSEAVKLLGLSGLPQPGQEFVVTVSLDAARTEAASRAMKDTTARQEPPKHVTLEDLFRQMKDSRHKELKLVIKADVQGSLEAICDAVRKIKSDKIDLSVIHKAVGPVTENDVLLASASDAIIIGFNVKIEAGVSDKAKHEGVQVKLYSVIYELIDQVEKAMEGLLEPEIRETVLGHAEIKQVFEVSKGKVAGCLVKNGRVARNARVRLLRRQQTQIETRIASLKRFQDDVAEVRAGQDCGIRLENYSDYQPGDIIECYQAEKVAQKL